MQPIYVFLFIFASLTLNSGVEGRIGVNYEVSGNNLPSPAQVIDLLKSRNIQSIRITEPNPDVLKALEGSGIYLTLTTRNEDLQALATNQTFAIDWVRNNVVPYVSKVKFRYISVGNDVIPGPLATFLERAMTNMYGSLIDNNIDITVTTTISLRVLGTSYPPSNGTFSEDAIPYLKLVAGFLSYPADPLLLNVYPYLAYSENPTQIPLDYALFRSTAPVVIDGPFKYNNLLHAMVDSVYAALEKLESSIGIVVTETGWPSAGGVYATIENAQTYANNLIAEVYRQGTPRRPDKALETYIFSLFNDDQKPAGVKQNFGLFYPNMSEVYHVNF